MGIKQGDPGQLEGSQRDGDGDGDTRCTAPAAAVGSATDGNGESAWPWALPDVIVLEILYNLGVRGLGRSSCVSRGLRDACAAECLWVSLWDGPLPGGFQRGGKAAHAALWLLAKGTVEQTRVAVCETSSAGVGGAGRTHDGRWPRRRRVGEIAAAAAAGSTGGASASGGGVDGVGGGAGAGAGGGGGFPVHISCMAISDGVLATAAGPEITVWDLEVAAPRALFKVSGHGSVTCLLLRHGTLLAGDNSGYLRSYDITLSGGAPLDEIRAHADRVTAIDAFAFNNDHHGDDAPKQTNGKGAPFPSSSSFLDGRRSSSSSRRTAADNRSSYSAAAENGSSFPSPTSPLLTRSWDQGHGWGDGWVADAEMVAAATAAAAAAAAAAGAGADAGAAAADAGAAAKAGAASPAQLENHAALLSSTTTRPVARLTPAGQVGSAPAWRQHQQRQQQQQRTGVFCLLQHAAEIGGAVGRGRGRGRGRGSLHGEWNPRGGGGGGASSSCDGECWGLGKRQGYAGRGQREESRYDEEEYGEEVRLGLGLGGDDKAETGARATPVTPAAAATTAASLVVGVARGWRGETRRVVLFTGSDDGTAKAWSAQTGRFLCTYAGHARGVTCLQATFMESYGPVLVTGGGDSSVIIWELATGRCLERLETGAGLAANPNGPGPRVGCLQAYNNSIVVGEDRHVSVWSLSKGQRPTLTRRNFCEHQRPIRGLEVVGRWILTCSGDHVIRLWDSKTGLCVREMGTKSGAAIASFRLSGLCLLTTSLFDPSVLMTCFVPPPPPPPTTLP